LEPDEPRGSRPYLRERRGRVPCATHLVSQKVIWQHLSVLQKGAVF